jgi:hypothetical protein
VVRADMLLISEGHILNAFCEAVCKSAVFVLPFMETTTANFFIIILHERNVSKCALPVASQFYEPEDKV